MPFWNLVTGDFGLRVMEIWVEIEAWKYQTWRWWINTP